MALVEPLIGHLLSKYKETVLEGLAKIRTAVQAGDEQGTALATAITQQEEALQAIRATLLKPDYFVATTQTLTVVLNHLAERGSRVTLAREVLRGDCAALFRKTLATLSDASLPHVIAALQFLTVAVKDAPLLVLARLRNPTDAQASSSANAASSISGPTPAVQRRADVPLHLAAFRLQLTYGQRRIRLVRLAFLVQLITSPMHNAVAETVCSHGVLTHLLENAAELLREGTSAGVTCAMEALRVVRERFVQSRDVTSEQKRRVLLAQRNIFRLLVRALEFDPVADHAAAILYAIVDETIESPADYASTRVESLEDHGMPNYLLFFLLRQLRPKASERMAELVLHILQRAPDLIRPYFIRISGHLAEEGSAHGVAPTTARVAVVNLMTRAFLCPMPYHLAAAQVQLEPVAAKTSTFYSMCPRDVADEICPAWVAEYVHRLINGSTNLLLLALAMQLTQAALMRAKRVLPLVQVAQRASEMRKAGDMATGAASGNGSGGETPPYSSSAAAASLAFSRADLAALQGSDDADVEVWDTYDAQVRHHLQAALPSREEFWHRMTQQLHRSLTSTIGAAPNDATLTKVHLVTQRMLLLMRNYVDVFDVRAPWLSSVPSFLPDLKRVGNSDTALTAIDRQKKHGRLEKHTPAGLHPITAALQQHNDILHPWPAASVAMLCQLLVASHQRRVPMVKLHHVNMSQAQGVGEWPLLLSILLWVTHRQHRSASQTEASLTATATAVAAVERAAGWAAQLLLWTVHSVTIHSTCTLAEAHLWLSRLTPNTVPVFLHVLNHLLMRSLSKAADRVTHELREASSGVLVAAAEHFIERTKEKQLQKSGAAEAASEAIASPSGARQNGKKQSKAGGNGNRSSTMEGEEEVAAGTNLWGTHLYAALAEFEAVVQSVKQAWPARDAELQQADAVLLKDSAAPQVTQQQCIDVLVLGDRQRGFVTTKGQAAMSAVQQLRTFLRTLHSPVLPLPEEEAEMALLTRLHGTTSGAARDLDEDENEEKSSEDGMHSIRAALGIRDAVPSTHSASAAAAPPRWYAMSSVCWHVAGRLLAALHRRGRAAEGMTSAAAQRVALGLIRAVLARRADVEAILGASSARDGSAVGLLVLLLTCVRILLTSATLHNGEGLSQDEMDKLGALCLTNYAGGLTVQDRLCYAVCLALHYLADGPASAVTAEPPIVKIEDEAHAAGRNNTAPRHRRRTHHSHSDHENCSDDAEDVQQRCVFHGAMVPRALVRHRFLIAGHAASAFRTTEVEMLSWHLDTLTEADMTRMALCVSSRLHNGLVQQRRTAATGDDDGSSAASGLVVAAEDVLCAVYPELYGAADVDVANLDRLTSGDVLDLRYIISLLHRVTSLPPAYLEHLSTGRVIPLLLKGLTSIDVSIRSAAAAALSTMYIPKGALRIVVGVARLKLCQLHSAAAAEATAAKKGAVLPTALVPRLPTPLAVFLVMAIQPLARYEDALHHHLIHFLVHIDAALATPVPFARWTSTPPLTAISVPLMLEKQEALQQRTHRLGGSGGGGGNIAQASAADVAQELRRGIPPQLQFVLRLLRHACEVPQDGAALLASDSLSGLMLLCDLLTASDVQRATYVRCLLELCMQSATLTRLFAQQGNALVWTVGFLWELCKEYGAETPHPYSGLTFTATLQLLRVLCVGTLTGPVSAVPLSAASVDQLKENLGQLRVRVVAAHVTARDILDAFDEMIVLCESATRFRVDTGAASIAITEDEAAAALSAAPAPPSQPGKRNRGKTFAASSEKKLPSKRVKVENAL